MASEADTSATLLELILGCLLVSADWEGRVLSPHRRPTQLYMPGCRGNDVCINRDH